MNALRQFVTVTNDTLTIRLPREYQQRRLEIIVLPADSIDDSDDELGNIMDKMSEKAEKNGLTPDILAKILKEV